MARAWDGIVPALLAGCDGAARGMLLSIALVFGMWLVGIALLLAWSAMVGASSPRSGSGADVLLALMIGVPIAAVASGRATETLAWHGELRMVTASRAVALVGALVLVLLFAFAVRVTWLPAMLLAEMGIVAAWVAGSARPDGAGAMRLTVPRWIVLSVVLGFGLFLAWAAGAGTRRDGANWPPDRDLTLVGERLPDDASPPVGWEIDDGTGSLALRLVAGEGDGRRWSDVRVELWAAVPRDSAWSFADDRVGDPDPGVAGPIRVVPMGTDPAHASATIRYDDIRGLREGLIVVTGVADGRRYAFGDFAVLAEYRATPLMWLASLAPDSPDAVHRVTP
jgi:hypothetical protein